MTTLKIGALLATADARSFVESVFKNMLSPRHATYLLDHDHSVVEGLEHFHCLILEVQEKPWKLEHVLANAIANGTLCVLYVPSASCLGHDHVVRLGKSVHAILNADPLEKPAEDLSKFTWKCTTYLAKRSQEQRTINWVSELVFAMAKDAALRRFTAMQFVKASEPEMVAA